MLKIAMLVVALIAASVGCSNAEKQPNLQSVWAAWVRHAVPDKIEVIRKMRGWRDARCTKLMAKSKRTACTVSYNSIISLRKEELATLKKWLAGLKNNSKFKPSRAEGNGYNRRDRIISNKFGELWEVYHP